MRGKKTARKDGIQSKKKEKKGIRNNFCSPASPASARSFQGSAHTDMGGDEARMEQCCWQARCVRDVPCPSGDTFPPKGGRTGLEFGGC